jgi:hypothetical protein
VGWHVVYLRNVSKQIFPSIQINKTGYNLILSNYYPIELSHQCVGCRAAPRPLSCPANQRNAGRCGSRHRRWEILGLETQRWCDEIWWPPRVEWTTKKIPLLIGEIWDPGITMQYFIGFGNGGIVVKCCKWFICAIDLIVHFLRSPLPLLCSGQETKNEFQCHSLIANFWCWTSHSGHCQNYWPPKCVVWKPMLWRHAHIGVTILCLLLLKQTAECLYYSNIKLLEETKT